MIARAMTLSRSTRHSAVFAVFCSACASTKSEPRVDAAVSHDAANGSEERFSFFVTSYRATQALSGSENGFGGDLRYGETGPGARGFAARTRSVRRSPSPACPGCHASSGARS